MFDVWKNVLEEVEQNIPHASFTTWFKDVYLNSIEDGVVIIRTPNVFKEGQIRKKYDGVIRDALKHNSVEFIDVKYIVSAGAKVKPRSREISADELTTVNKTRRASAPRQAKEFDSNLSPDYTMDNFVVGSNNDLAASVAQVIIKEPGSSRYNPFYLYGGSGLGKTHLVQAIGNELTKTRPELKVMYVSTNSFYNEFINALGVKQGNKFTNKYQKVDVLIIDDIQLLINKEASQNAFFDIFNELHQRGKQIIITSDRLPEQLKTLDVRLSSRLASGGAFDIQLPKFEDKCAILRMKAEYDGVEIEDEAIEYIANNVKTNIRDLEGEYKKILAFAELKGVSPLEIINSGYINSGAEARRNIVSPKKIVGTVADASGLSVKEMCGKSRVSHIKTARQITMYILSEELGLSTTKIALEVGVKDHTTVMHGIKKIRADMKSDFAMREKVAMIREKIYA